MNTILTSFILTLVLATSSFAECNAFQKMWGCKDPIAAAATIPAFSPSFEDVDQYSGPPNRQIKGPANSTNFATEETAKWLMQKFGADHIEIQPAIFNIGAQYVFASGPDAGKPAFYRNLVFLPGTFLRNNSGIIIASVVGRFDINAGVLAGEYLRNPEAQFPEQHFTYGYPPVQGVYLSNAEQGVWRVLNTLNNELIKQRDAAEKDK